METIKKDHPVTELADALEVSASGFADHQRKDQRPRALEDRQLMQAMVPLFEKSRCTYGSPRLLKALQREGWRCGSNRVARLQRRLGLRPRQKRRWRFSTTKTDPRLATAPNWLAKVPAADHPNEIWVADITYIPTAEGWLYLAAVLDLYSRKIVGWNTATDLSTALVTTAWQKAIASRRPPRGLLHHSDRGCQYASLAFGALLQASGSTASMSRAGNCYDNAAMESFWATLKTEAFESSTPPTRHHAKLLIFDYIESFYNRSRLHSSLNFQSPLEFESNLIHINN